MKKNEKVEFDDGSEIEIPDMWRECVKIKYGYSWEHYWTEYADLVGKLWEEGVY